MEANRVVGVFKRMAGQDQHDRLARCDFSVGTKFFQSGQRDRRGWLAAETLGTELRLGDRYLCLGDIEAPTARVSHDPRSFAPRRGIADANRSCPSVSLDRLHLSPLLVAKLRASGLAPSA